MEKWKSGKVEKRTRGQEDEFIFSSNFRKESSKNKSVTFLKWRGI
jgi:hypothetical protein